MASIARKNLLEDIPRFLTAQAGIMFAVSLVTIQTGLQSGFTRSTSLLIDQSKADIWVASKNMVHLDLTLPISYKRLLQARYVQGVDRAEGVIISGAVWRQLEVDKISSISLIGAEPEGLLFSPLNITQGSLKELEQPYSFIMDQSKVDAINLKQVGEVGTLNSVPAKLVGLAQGAQSIVFGNLVFTSLETANTYVNGGSTNANSLPSPVLKPLTSTDQITYVLVRAKAGENIEALKRRLEEELPDTRAYTRAQMSLLTQNYWQERSGIGFVLGLGAVVGVIVGVVVVGQILYASVSDHLKEFGTLKAMGASDWYIYRVIIEQGLWMGILGYLPSMALCLGVAAWTAATQGITILITPASAIAVLGVTIVMCVGSAIFAIQKVTRVDPAIVFKG